MERISKTPRIYEEENRRYLEIEIPEGVSPRQLVKGVLRMQEHYVTRWLLAEIGIKMANSYDSTHDERIGKLAGVGIKHNLGNRLELESDLRQGAKIEFSVPRKHNPMILTAFVSAIFAQPLFKTLH